MMIMNIYSGYVCGGVVWCVHVLSTVRVARVVTVLYCCCCCCSWFVGTFCCAVRTQGTTPPPRPPATRTSHGHGHHNSQGNSHGNSHCHRQLLQGKCATELCLQSCHTVCLPDRLAIIAVSMRDICQHDGRVLAFDRQW